RDSERTLGSWWMKPTGRRRGSTSDSKGGWRGMGSLSDAASAPVFVAGVEVGESRPDSGADGRDTAEAARPRPAGGPHCKSSTAKGSAKIAKMPTVAHAHKPFMYAPSIAEIALTRENSVPGPACNHC